MIKAFQVALMWLAGATFEVRLIKLQTGKDIPGRLYYRGGYWQARRYFNKKRPKLGQAFKLQAICQIEYTIAAYEETAEMIIFDEASKVPDSAWDIHASNERQSEFMHQHQDEPNVDQGEDEHECNDIGPLDWDFSADDYRKTCSICGAMQETGLKHV